MFVAACLAPIWICPVISLPTTQPALGKYKHARREVPSLCAVQNDFTPEEEEIVRRENQWAFD